MIGGNELSTKRCLAFDAFIMVAPLHRKLVGKGMDTTKDLLSQSLLSSCTSKVPEFVDTCARFGLWREAEIDNEVDTAHFPAVSVHDPVISRRGLTEPAAKRRAS